MQKQWFTYLGMAIALIAVATGVVYPDYGTIAWGIAGIFGFGSIAALRAFIDSNGKKTFIVSGIPILLAIPVMLGFIDLSTYQALMAAFLPIIGITVQQAQTKAIKK